MNSARVIHVGVKLEGLILIKHEPNRKRPIRKTARFTAAELAEIKRQQFEAGYNQFSAFARYRLFNSPIFNVSLIDGNAMLPRIRRVGDQLNQITHTVNLTGTVSKEQVGTVKELVGQLSKGIWCKQCER